MNGRLFNFLAAGSAALFSIGSAYALPNIALTGTANQSSIDPGGGFEGVASRGIDGNRDGDYVNGSVTHTDTGDPDPAPGLFEWWDVTLAQQYSFAQIIVFNRTDCCIERIEPFRLSVFNGLTSVYSVDVPSFVADITGPSIAGMTFTLGGQTGDRVRVQLTRQDFLSLAEVEAYATPIPEPTTLGLWGIGVLGVMLARRLRSKA